ncbi:hypothetical protein MKK75_18685 [Methylobacterium sp. J-030]|uniref:hypothetical protein n=1 Tax=Methylobacterium sp. J-030 TaxID=2836627 RepID=UPI001FBA5C2B|nr:hypothetical protein [Methylobacterium sp. J-030]MCJ2070792.1 hypothetical protein [Methylobacterium sp. J-030]
MGLTAFIVFVVPWMLLAAWLFTLPNAIRLGAPSTPWRPLYRFPDTSGGQHPNQQQSFNSYKRGAHDGSEPTSGNKHEPIAKPQGGGLGTSVEQTEPDDKV